jgi:hypothetical protein
MAKHNSIQLNIDTIRFGARCACVVTTIEGTEK